MKKSEKKGTSKEAETNDAPEPTRVDLILTEEEEKDLDQYDVEAVEIEEGEEDEDSKKYSVNGLQQYLFDVSVRQRRLLTKEEEQELGRKKDAGDAIAKKTLVTMNLKLVIKIARKYYRPEMGVSFLDIIQNGNMGLIKAAEKYDWKLGWKFSTYATYWIKQSIFRETPKQIGVIRYPTGVMEQLRKVNRCMQSFTEKHHREPTVKELARAAHMTTDEIKEIWRIKQGPVFLDEKFHGDDEDEGTMQQMLSDGERDSSYEQVAELMLMQETGELIKNLTGMEYDVIVKRYGLNGEREHTLDELAELYGCSTAKVSNVEQDALDKLRDVKGGSVLAGYLV